MPVNLWTFLNSYDTGGNWVFYPNGVNNGNPVPIFNLQDVSNDGIGVNDFNNNSQFQYCVGLEPCEDCEIVNLAVSSCSDTNGNDPCNDCTINILGINITCISAPNFYEICVRYQANECTDAASPDGNGWTIGYSEFIGNSNVGNGQSHPPLGGFQINNTGAFVDICWTTMLNPNTELINFSFTDANTNNDTRGCLSKGTGQGSGAFVYPTNGLPTC